MSKASCTSATRCRPSASWGASFDTYLRNNVQVTQQLLELARSSKRLLKFVYASSSSVYGNSDAREKVETLPTRPLSPYAAGKLLGEHYTLIFNSLYGLPTVALRYSNVYGPRQDPHGEAGVVAIFIEKFLAGQQPRINGDGLQTRDFVFVGDIVAANLLALDYPKAGAFNIGTGRETDILTIYLQLQEYLGSPLGPVHGPAKPGEQRRSVLDSNLAQNELGWQPRVSLAQGLAQTAAAFREAASR